MENDEWLQLFVAEQPLFKQHGQMERFIHCRDIVGIAAEKALAYGEDGVVHCLFTRKDFERMQEDGKKLLDHETATAVIQDITNQVSSYWRIVQKIRQECVNTGDMHDPNRVARYKELDTVLLKIFSYLATTNGDPLFFVEQALLEELQKIGEENEYITLVSPTREDLLLKEKKSWLNVMQNPTDTALFSHMHEYPLLFGNMDSEEDAFRLMKERIAHETSEKIEAEINKSEQRLKTNAEIQGKIFAKSRRVEQLATFLQQATLVRLEMKATWQGMHYFLFPLYKKISEETGQSVRDVMMFWNNKEVIAFMEQREAIPKEEIEQRKKAYVYLYENGRINFYRGDEAVAMKEKMLAQNEKRDEIRGMVANKGKTIGKVRIIRFDDLRKIYETAASITEPFILVTGMTNPNMVPLIKKAQAIVTDEGGMTCHAAIISREFNVPCIVGTKGATNVLHDGDIVEVDADTGIVRKIQKDRFSPEHIKQSWEPNDASIQARTIRGEGTSAPNPAEIEVYERYVSEHVKNKQNPRALVLGATPELRDSAIKYSCETVAVDISRSVRIYLTSRMRFQHSPLNKSIHGDWLEMEQFFEPESFDIVLADASLNNVPPEGNWNVLTIIKKLLKKGGIFVTRNLVVPEKRITRTPDDISAEYNAGKNTSLGFFLEMGYKTDFFETAYNPATKEYFWNRVIPKFYDFAKNMMPERKEAVERQALQAATVTHIVFPKQEFENLLKEFFTIKEIVSLPQFPYTSYVPIYILQN